MARGYVYVAFSSSLATPGLDHGPTNLRAHTLLLHEYASIPSKPGLRLTAVLDKGA